jgi:hypothetical protein
MADEIKNANANADDSVNRRQFLTKLGLGSLSVAAAGTAAFAYQFLDPNVLYVCSPTFISMPQRPNRSPTESASSSITAAPRVMKSQASRSRKTLPLS